MWAKISGVLHIQSLTEFEDMLCNLLCNVRGESPEAIAGDFNKRAPQQGTRKNNAKGRRLLEVFAQSDIVLVNKGKVKTFQRGGLLIVDLSFVSSALPRGMSWYVSEDYIHSGHQTIIFELWREPHCKNTTQPKPRRISGWSTKALQKQTFMEMWLTACG